MCTVSFIPDKDNGGFVLTSNRDEIAYRATDVPKVYKINKKELCFPKDVVAGGSWIAMNNKGRVVCLLNGAFVNHQKKPKYAQSRGNILIELVSSDKTPNQYFSGKDFTEIEPFTIVAIEKKGSKISHFSEFIWDGSDKHFRQPDSGKPQIWSSVTLYSPEIRQLRKQWFRTFLAENEGNISPEKILEFHSGNHIEDNSINVIMQRKGGLKTVSISQVRTARESLNMKYFDLHNNFESEVKL